MRGLLLVCLLLSLTSIAQQFPDPHKGPKTPAPGKGNQIPDPNKGPTIPKPPKGNQIPDPNKGTNIPEPPKGNQIPDPQKGPDVLNASSTYVKMNIKLPFSNTPKDYMVRKEGSFFILNGDIIVGDDFPKTMSASSENTDHRWHNATMPIVIDPSIYENGLGQIVHDALREFNSKAELCLVPRDRQKDYIRIIFSTEILGTGRSRVGRHGGEQPLLLSDKAEMGTVIHELMHAAGFYHEQCREDRDNFVRINEDNLKPGSENNFEKEESAMYGDYDYCSIMHYSATLFSKDGVSPTIECISEGKVGPCPPCLGNRVTFSRQDLDGIDRFYGNVSRFPCNTYFPNPAYTPVGFGTHHLSESNIAQQVFRQHFDYATKNRFVGAYPTFYTRNSGPNVVVETILFKPGKAIWRDVPLASLGNPSIEDFGARMRATQQYATKNGFIAGFPNYYHENYGNGIVCGTILFGSAAAEWRDVPISELGNPGLDDLRGRMRSAHDYAVRNGYVSGFPTFFHADYGNGIVCGIILIKKEAAEFRERIVDSVVR